MKRRGWATVPERPHGYARYKLDGCRCYTCGWAVSEYTRRRLEAVANGRGPVDGDVLRVHLRSLAAAGMGYKRAADVAGVARSTVGRILYGRPDRGTPPTPRVRYAIARKLLAVRAVDHGPNKPIEASGTVRRIRALIAIGWTRTEIARGIGWSLANLGTMLHRGAEPWAGFVEVRTAAAVSALYDRLSMHPSTGPHSARARAEARSNGWPPPLAWDDDEIDDPAAAPTEVAA